MGQWGSKPGERRGGRQKGTPNKSTVELATLARQHTDLALGVYIETIKGVKHELEIDANGKSSVKTVPRYSNDARQRASGALLDRGWGTPTQAHLLMGTGEGGAIPLEHNLPDLKNLSADDLIKLYRAVVAPE